MVDIREVIHGWKPVMVMVVVQIGYSIMNILNKLTVNDGMNMTILVAYRMVFAAAFIVPLALIVERKRRPKLTWMILFQASLSGLFGVFLTQNLFITSLYLTSATFVTAIINLIPAATFFMAICFRMENVKLETRSGKAKILGTIIGIGGAMIFTFYKGPEINIWSTKVNLLHHGEPQNGGKGSHNYFLGFLSALGSCLTYAVWLIVQTKMGERYPCQYSSTALISMIGLIQCVVLALCTQKDWKEWKLGWNIRLYTSIYSGIVVSGLVISLVTWCVVKRGPVFVSVFYPLLLLLTAIGEFLVLDEKLHCGSIVGATLIAGGLYLVLWGKNKEIKKAEIIPSQSLDESELADQIVHDGDSSKKDQETIAIEESIR